MTKPVREFSANVGDASTGLAGPDTIEKDLDKALKMFDPLALLPDGVNYGGISGENIKQVTTAASLPTTGLSIPDIRLVKDPAGDGSVPPALYVWDGTTWRSFNSVVDYALKFDGTAGHKHTGVAGDAPQIPINGIANGSTSAGLFHFAGDAPFNGTALVRNEASTDQDAWYTVGPSGSGASIIWTALDSVPNGAKGIKLSALLYSYHGAAAIGPNTIGFRVRKGGTVADPTIFYVNSNLSNEISWSGLSLDVQLDSGRKFELYWHKQIVSGGVANFNIFLEGWYI